MPKLGSNSIFFWNGKDGGIPPGIVTSSETPRYNRVKQINQLIFSLQSSEDHMCFYDFKGKRS